MVQDRTIRLRRLLFHYREWSTRGAPLVLLHGLSSQSHIFDRVAPLLASHFRVIAFDQRGHGESPKPDDGYDFQTVGSDLLALLDALHLKHAILAGHSWGGNVALHFAAVHPERTRALILIDGGFLDLQSNPEMTWARTEKELAPPYLEDMPVSAFKALIKQYAGKRWTPQAEQAILANFEITPEDTIRRRLNHSNHMKILRALWEQRPPELYPRIRCPVLILPAVMDSDENREWLARRRAQVETAHAALEKNRVVWFHDTIHDIPLQRPRKLANTIIRFARDEKLIS